MLVNYLRYHFIVHNLLFSGRITENLMVYMMTKPDATKLDTKHRKSFCFLPILVSISF